MIEARQLLKKFNGNTAVNQLNFKIEAGEVFALLGPNAAGKTTTINIRRARDKYRVEKTERRI